MSGYHFCIGAELLKHTWDKWPAAEQSRFETMIRDIWYPVIKEFYPTANGDQAHTQMGLEFLANTCETAWIQGVDLYGALDNRLLRGFEYTAKYNLGLDVPYEPYESVEGRYHYKTISGDRRGRLRPMYERVFNHYHNRKGLDAPYTEQAALKLRSVQMDTRDDRNRRERRRDGRRRRGRSTSSHLDTLMYAAGSSSL